MKVIRDNEFIFRGEVINNGKPVLQFESSKYDGYYILVREAKYINVKNNEVTFLKVRTDI